MYKGSKLQKEAFSFSSNLFQEEPNYEYGKQMTYITTLLATQKRDFYQSTDQWKAALKQATLEDNAWQVVFPGYAESAAKIATELQNAYMGKKTPEQALADAEKAGGEAVKAAKP